MEEKKSLRVYEKDTLQYHLYREMHINQTLEKVSSLKEKYGKCDQIKMTVGKSLSMLDDFVDPSDPDLDVPNSIQLIKRLKEYVKNIQMTRNFKL